MFNPTALSVLLTLNILSAAAGGQKQASITDFWAGADLLSFVSRPDIRAPRWNVTKHHPDLITPGYWFVAPYTTWATVPDRLEFSPAQVGPHIYDGDGNLIWSGAALAHNRNAFDFRTFKANGSTHLSYVLHYSRREGDEEQHGQGVYLDSSYRQIGRVTHNIGIEFNFHEFDIRDDGKSALLIATDRTVRQEPTTGKSGWVAHDCIKELDLTTGEDKFWWCPLDNGVQLNETYDNIPDMEGVTEGGPWDFLHGNSIDKFEDGDYLYSARHVNTIYRVNHTDKSIVWRLGGKLSDFEMDFNFSSQHHASVQSDGGSIVRLTFLDNAADDQGRQPTTSTTSSAKLVELDTDTMTATLVDAWYRPDGKLSDKRGNVNTMPNGNIFVAWSENGYMTEHTATEDKKLVLEAKFTSHRFSTYRAFKANFSGNPIERPVVKAFATQSGRDASYSMTTFYVSWNGATEVKRWEFFGSQGDNVGEFQYLGTTNRTGFETTFSEKGLWLNVYAKAIAEDGKSLRTSNIERCSAWPGSPPLKTNVQIGGMAHGSSASNTSGNSTSPTTSAAETAKTWTDQAKQNPLALWVFVLMLVLQVVVVVALSRCYRRIHRATWKEDQVELLSKGDFTD
ncbi:hypothetical protein PV08_02981 [Exophiala spinifera]|uniref:ASST-domain-containing protein n=1 Tax=Exophiala spinifera TaxID=91928 RepID=A0A0D2A136_9EURO|nr:uncharacterized protein PV08_02981 [Exophiala spinifera]KIW18692.1 hypothetical protein PV08_02981 [Exophiala spinifera]